MSLTEVFMIREVEVRSSNGLPVLLGSIFLFLLALSIIINAASEEEALWLIAAVPMIVAGVFGMIGLMNIAPNEGRVLQLFGKYVGTAREQGLRWANPFYTKRKVSLRVR